MIVGSVFLDTVFVQALLNRADQFHANAVLLFQQLGPATQIWTTESVLTEIANALSAINRSGAIRFIGEMRGTSNVEIMTVDRSLFDRAFNLYQRRSDKEWGLTDCISFTVMMDQKITEALTADSHFEQAGFIALMRKTSV